MLRDYTHYTATTVGFSDEVDEQIHDAIDLTEECNRLFFFGCILTVYTLHCIYIGTGDGWSPHQGGPCVQQT